MTGNPFALAHLTNSWLGFRRSSLVPQATHSSRRFACFAVTLGMLTATFVSSKLGWVTPDYFQGLQARLRPWHEPYEQKLKSLDLSDILAAIKHDKKNTRSAVNCILTRGAGRMEKFGVSLEDQLRPWVGEFIKRVG